MKAMAKMEEGSHIKEQTWKTETLERQVLDNLLHAFLSQEYDGTIQGSQKRFSGFKTSNCNT
jgi:hypothetical protein